MTGDGHESTRWLNCLCCYAAVAASRVAVAACAVERVVTSRPVAVCTAPDPEAVRRGVYLAASAYSASCHTANAPGAAPYAGGGKVPTPFGVYYGRDITPDVSTGIGG